MMLGHSYLLVQISRAWDAHSSPRRNGLAEGLILGFGVNRAATAQTDSTSTGGRTSFLPDVSPVRKLLSHPLHSRDLP